jgi:predicted nucleotidyltransferase
MDDRAIKQRFTAALDALIERIKDDRSILAAVLCGSLSHDAVWDRSDIDLVLVTVDDKKITASDAALYADGVNIHANLVPRAEFRKIVDGSTHNSFMHALLAKGRLLYTHDPTIAELCESLHDIGARDTALQLLRAATGTLPAIDKAHKWFVTRADLDYSALWILYAATGLARIEIISRRQVADREVLPQALELNPAFFKVVYTDLLNATKTKAKVEAALAAIDGYIGDRAPMLFGLVLEYLQEAREVRSSSEIDAHFKRSFDVNGVTTACEYLAHRGLIGKASLPRRLTKRSNLDVQELAFFHLSHPADALKDW